MKYIKLYEDIFTYEKAFVKYSSFGTDGIPTIMNFCGQSGIFKATKFAKELIENGSINFDKSKGYVMITTQSDSLGYNNLIKWWGKCEWEKEALKLSNVYVYNKYLYGLEEAYDKYIASSKNVYNIVKYIKENQPNMWKILLLHDPSIEKGADMSNIGFSDD